MTSLSPGVQTREIDFSYYVKHLSTSSAGMVGVTERGPINQPVLVTSWEQFVNRFGTYIQAGYLAYAARAFFDNGGSVLYVNRIVHLPYPNNRESLTAAKSSVMLRGRGGAAHKETGTVGTDRIRWFAREGGPLGDNITVEVRVSPDPNSGLTTRTTDQDDDPQIHEYQVSLATDGDGNPISTADEVVNLTNALSHGLVYASTDDNGIVQPVPTFNLAGGEPGKDTLRVLAVNEGRWGDEMAVRIEDGARDPANAFKIVVVHAGVDVEIFEDLTMDESTSNHVELAVNGPLRVHHRRRPDADLRTDGGPSESRHVRPVRRRRRIGRSPGHRLHRRPGRTYRPACLRRDRRPEPGHGPRRHHSSRDPRRHRLRRTTQGPDVPRRRAPASRAA